jgi:hypothetical protein
MPALVPGAAANQPNLWVGTLYVSGDGAGFAEKYALNIPCPATPRQADYLAAVVAFGAICVARAWLLPLNFSLLWGRVSAANQFRDSAAAFNQPLYGGLLTGNTPPEATIETCNEPDDALMWRFEDQAGHFSQRLIGAVRDSWIADAKAASGINVGFDGLGAILGTIAVPAPLTAATVINNFLVALQNNACLATQKGADVNTWNLYPYQNCIYRYAGNRKRGRPFGLSRGRAAVRV